MTMDILSVDYRAVVSRADIEYDTPATRSEEGLPIGNGRMGSLIWTTPDALRFQINRVDVFADNCETRSFPRANTDYAGGCGYVDLCFVDFGEEVFSGPAFRQRLSVYDGLVTVEGNDVTARVLACHERDVVAVEIDDRREQPAPVSIDLRMLRFAHQYVARQNYELTSQHANQVQSGGHTATSRLDIRDGSIVLVQEFREGNYYNASAVAIGVVGRKSAARFANESTVRLSAAPGKGKYIVLIASAATFDSARDVAALALEHLKASAAEDFGALLTRSQAHWHDFWSRGLVHLHSDDGVADFVEQNYTYFLYVMASCSQSGAFPPRFGGMLWFTNGDMRQWGTQQWWANLSCYYNGLAPANRFELMDPMFALYSGMYDSCARAARQQWGSEGIFIPETVWFDGLEELPEDIAAEMRDLYLVRKPWEERSEKFRRFAETKSRFSSRWNWMGNATWEDGRWIMPDKGAGPFGHTNHILGTTAKIAYLYWQRYEYTQDTVWLRDRAYPMLRGATEFYRHFPNVRKGDDGKYHIHHTNSNEPIWGAKDTDEDLSAMRGIVAVTIRAAELLNVDADRRAAWKEFLDNLAPLPTSDHPEAIKPADYQGPRVWVKALHPAAHGNGMRPDANTLPMWNFDLCTLENPDPQTAQLAHATFEGYYPHGIAPDTPVSVLSQLPIAAAALGRADAVRYLLPNQLRCLAPDRDFCDWAGSGKGGVLRNRLTLREGPGATECQRLGRVAEALHTALLQSTPPMPGQEPVLRVFPAWPKEWDAEYTLLARGAFLVTAAMRKGAVEFVSLRSQAGGTCRLRNPWNAMTVTLHRNGKKAEDLSGSLLTFPTARGETVMGVPQGAKPPG
jgi:hypothetical protein